MNIELDRQSQQGSIQSPELLAPSIARKILDGFDKHYSIYSALTKHAYQWFERQDWAAIQDASRKRIGYFDQRVRESVDELYGEHQIKSLDTGLWRNVKLQYMGLLYQHKRPELAESFYNSVFCRLFDRRYYNNDHIFVRPALSTGFIKAGFKDYESYYPGDSSWKLTTEEILHDVHLEMEYEDIDRDVENITEILDRAFNQQCTRRRHLQVHILAPLFFRNKGVYVIGRVINGSDVVPLIFALLTNDRGELYVDTVLMQHKDVTVFLSYTRAYFLVDTEVPATVVQFLQSLLPNKSSSDLYTCIGFQKHGKTEFYRDYLFHLRHSNDQLDIAPGILGMVMSVFTMPSFPYVFKVIKDHFHPAKQVSTATVKEKYLLVKQHDRVGRMADTWEFSNVAFPVDRISDQLMEHLNKENKTSLEFDGDQLIIRHLYIERRVTPLNLYLEMVAKQQVDAIIKDYGNAIKELAAANIFPGDLLFKNFGVTRHGRVIFYDYDEIAYMTECKFRDVPPPRYPEDELAAEPWYAVGKSDVFPEELSAYLLSDAKVREPFLRHHTDLLSKDFWLKAQSEINQGHLIDVFPYPQQQCFKR